ncbi:gustatory receptor 39a [Haematobia irritans]|uniref:gustatory receptor 39a n=1 Tax=Haematobia irritans TaxID=7368 RepID=UPI003F4F4515
MAVHFEDSENCFYIKGNFLYYLHNAVIQILILGSCVMLLYTEHAYFIGDFNDTSNYYIYLTLQASFALHSTLRIWLISNQHSHFRILDFCRKWNSGHMVQTLTFPTYIKIRLSILIAVIGLYLVNSANVFLQVHGQFASRIFYIGFAMTIYCCLMSTVILFIYTAVVLTVSNIMKSISISCEKLFLACKNGMGDTEIKQVETIMLLYGEVSYVTSEDVNTVYGISILMCTIMVLMETIWDVFVLAISNPGSNRLSELQTLIWMLPMCTILVIGLLCNNLNEEIDKFLLKNLRQKPILTAYGFFSLDKGTLFKLFTTVFTYMVVLVQFKEMESNTKLLQKES